MRKLSIALRAGGILCLLAAVGMIFYNLHTEQQAEVTAQTGVVELAQVIQVKPQEEQPVIPEAQTEMTCIELKDGYSYIGILEIPALGRTLPIQDRWSSSLLKVSPCLYKGSLYEGMIIAGHNYRSHFAGLSKLVPGDTLRFTDMDGNVWNYHVEMTEIIAGTDVEGMESGDWDLTLFTCTYGGQSRITIRCVMDANL